MKRKRKRNGSTGALVGTIGGAIIGFPLGLLFVTRVWPGLRPDPGEQQLLHKFTPGEEVGSGAIIIGSALALGIAGGLVGSKL